MTEPDAPALGAIAFADPQALLRLAAWISPAFPVGAFGYSHGLERAVADARVDGPEALSAWISDALEHGAGRSDAILLAHAWRAGAAGDAAALADLAELARALAPSRQRLAETAQPGAAFASTVEAAWETPGAPAPYPVALGQTAGVAGVPLEAVLPLAVQGFAAALVSAGIRLVPVGQTDGQRILAGHSPLIARIAAEAADAPLDAIGSAAFRIDIDAMTHETLETRLFRS
jgi:urease accessory protein